MLYVYAPYVLLGSFAALFSYMNARNWLRNGKKLDMLLAFFSAVVVVLSVASFVERAGVLQPPVHEEGVPTDRKRLDAGLGVAARVAR